MIQVPADSVLGEDHLPGLWAAAFSLSAHVAFPGQRESCLSSTSYRGTSPIMMVLSSSPHLNLFTSHGLSSSEVDPQALGKFKVMDSS